MGLSPLSFLDLNFWQAPAFYPSPVYLRLFQLAHAVLSDPAICSFCSVLFRADLPALQPSSQPSSCCLCALSKGAVENNRKAGVDALCDQGSSEFHSLIPIHKWQFELVHILLSLLIFMPDFALTFTMAPGFKIFMDQFCSRRLCPELECGTSRFS